jgi:hypothetical protein
LEDALAAVEAVLGLAAGVATGVAGVLAGVASLVEVVSFVELLAFAPRESFL